jgi:hypothetical protein
VLDGLVLRALFIRHGARENTDVRTPSLLVLDVACAYLGRMVVGNGPLNRRYLNVAREETGLFHLRRQSLCGYLLSLFPVFLIIFGTSRLLLH